MTPDVRTTYRLVSMGVLPVWAGALLALCAATAALLLLRGEMRRRKRRKAPALLYAARTLLALLLGVLVMQPVLFIRREWGQPGVLALVADRSRSMLRADRYADAVLLDLASALKWPGTERREVLPGRLIQHLVTLEPILEAWRQQVFAIQDELAQGLPWGAAFEETVGRLARETAARSAELRDLLEALSKLEARLAAAPKPSGKSATPDPKLFAPLYLLADQLASLRDAMGKAAGAPLDEERAAGLLRAHDDLLSALRAATPAMAALQHWCDERFLGGAPPAARRELEGISKRSRFQLAKGLARQIANDPLLAARHRVRLLGFEDLAPANALENTDLFAPIDELLAGSLDEVVSGIVLFSDGRQNLPERPEVLRRLSGRDAALLLAGVGVGGEGPDVAIADCQLPGVLLGGQEATLVADLKAAVPKGTPIQVELSSGARPLASQSLEADGTGQARATLTFRAPQTGDEGLRLSARMPGGDAAPGNDQVSIAPHVLNRTARALVVAKWARWDVVYLLSALRGKPCRVDLVLWGGSSGKGVRRGLGLGKIPDQLSHLKRYGLIVLDGEPFPGMTQEDGQLFASYVREPGGVLVVIADGDKWYGPRLAGLLPGGELAPLEAERPSMGPLPSSAMLPAVSLSVDSATTLGTWRALPPAQHLWTVPDQAIPLLAAGGRTLLSVGFYGRGKLYALGCGDLFRLREWGHGEPAQRFLANLLDDALQPTFRDEKARLALYPFAPRTGATAHVLLDARGLGSTGGARVTLPDGTRAALAFEPLPGSPGLFHATFRVAAAGPITLEAPGVAPLSARAASSVSREDIDFTLDEATLRRLARCGGGRHVPLHGLARAVAELPPRLDHRVAVRQIRLWNLWWLLPALAALMAVDWVLRRRNSLVL